MMEKARHLCLWLWVFVFGLPAVGGSGLHTILPHDPDACHHGAGAPHGEFSLGGCGAAFRAAAHAEDDCFLCRFFLRHTVGWFFPAAVLSVGLTVPLAAASALFFAPCPAGSHPARSPPAAAAFLFA